MNDPNGIKRQEKIDEVLKVIDKMIKDSEYRHGISVANFLTDKAIELQLSIENLEKIKKILEK